MKSVQLHPAAEAVICAPASNVTSGVLLGQSWDARAYVLAAVPTPPLPKSEAGQPGWSRQEWVCEHARQVKRMLVGGVELLGCYVGDGGGKGAVSGGGADRLKAMESDGALRDIVFGMPLSSTCVDRLLLKSTVASKLTGELYTGSRKENLKPKPLSSSNLKTLNCVPSLICLATTLHLDLTFPLAPTTGADGLTLKKQIQRALDSFAATLASAPCTLDGQRIADPALALEKAFDSSSSSSSSSKGGKGKGGKGSKKSSSAAKKAASESDDGAEEEEHSVDFFLKPSSASDSAAEGSCEGMLRIKGACHSRVYAHNKYSIAQALASLRADVALSLHNRLQLLSEDSEDSTGSFDVPLQGSMPFYAWNFPRRLFVGVIDKKVPLCDYLMPHENEADTVRRVREMLGSEGEGVELGQSFCREKCEDTEEGAPAAEKPKNAKGDSSSSSSSSSASSKLSSSSTPAAPSSSSSAAATATATKDSGSNNGMLMAAFGVIVVAVSAAFLSQVM